MLMREQAEFDLAVRLRGGTATIAEIYGFISGLYFRGKKAYSEVFGAAPEGVSPAMVIVPGLGLVPPETILTLDQLRTVAKVPIEVGNEVFTGPFLRDAVQLKQRYGSSCQYILLGSIATDKYTRTLLDVFGKHLFFPEEFVGRGDMSRGGLMLRCALSGEELSYVTVEGAVRRGARPPKLNPLRKR
jgi:hypothetical protein